MVEIHVWLISLGILLNIIGVYLRSTSGSNLADSDVKRKRRQGYILTVVGSIIMVIGAFAILTRRKEQY